MKRIFPLLMCMTMLLGLAAVSTDAAYSTTVSYTNPNATEQFVLTVPTTLTAGESGTVTLKGTWPSNKTFTVSADTTVEMTCNLGGSKTLDVSFDGISLQGSNTSEASTSETVSVAAMTGVLFGEWSGVFGYYMNLTTQA